MATPILENKILLPSSMEAISSTLSSKKSDFEIVSESPKIKLKKQWIFEVLCKYLRNLPHVKLHGPVVFANLLQDDPSRKEVFSTIEVISTSNKQLREETDHLKSDLAPLFDQITISLKHRIAIIKCVKDRTIKFRIHWNLHGLEYIGIDIYLVTMNKDGVHFGNHGNRGEYSTVSNLFRNIHNRRFEILATHVPPMEPRTKYNLTEYSDKLMNFVLAMYQVASTLDLGWTCVNDITKMFVPCLIYQLPPLGINDELFQCSICVAHISPGKRVFRHACCKKMVCFDCILHFLKSKINSYSIECMYCLEDPFGWKTQRLQDSTDMDDSSDDSSD